MRRSDRRVLLHLVAGACWLVGFVADVEQHRWKAVGMALVSHVAAEFTGCELGGQVA